MRQNVVYRIHEDPDDPDSAITFTVWLSLVEMDADGDSIGWKIKNIRFRQPGTGGAPGKRWIESAPNPNVPTEDGLWWIDHADADNPQLSEFDHPPHLVGTATAVDPSDADLNYDFEGSTYSGSPPWSPTAGLDYEFAVDGEPTPLIDGMDEPVELEDDDDPPGE
jgi:hypothetical protein